MSLFNHNESCMKGLKLKEIAHFSLPIILGQVGLMLIGAGDVFMAGKHSTTVLAAIGVASGFQGPVFMLGAGLLMGVAPVLSQLRGEGEDSSIYYKTVLVYSVLVGVLCMALNIFAVASIDYIGLQQDIIPFVKRYLFLTSTSVMASMIFQGIKEYLQAFEKTVFANTIAIIAVIVNIAGNYLLVFGKLGFPILGEDGLAYMSIFTRVFMATLLWLYAIDYFKRSAQVNFRIFKRIYRLSLPISLGVLVEVMAFGAASILIGRMSTMQAATHNVIITMASISFMIPLAISSAASVKVGFSFGLKNKYLIQNYALSSLILSTLFMSLSASAYYFFPKELMSFFTQDQSVIEYGIKLIGIVCLFQVFDGIQITLSGILRGFSISKPVMVSCFISHWLFGFPIGLYMAYKMKLMAFGLWIGLACGLFLLSLLLSGIYAFKLRDIQFETKNW